MTKKMAAVLVACVSVFALCLALVGCGGDNKKDFLGDWELYEITSTESASATSHDDVEMLKGYGLTVTLTLAEDETASLNMFGEETTGTWKASSATKATLELENMGSADAELQDGRLTMSDGDSTLVFVRATE